MGFLMKVWALAQLFYREFYAPAVMAAVSAASAKYGDVATFKKALTAPGPEGGIIQGMQKVPGEVRGWACTLVNITPGDDMLTFIVNLANEMGVHAPKVDSPIAQAVANVSPPPQPQTPAPA